MSLIILTTVSQAAEEDVLFDNVLQEVLQDKNMQVKSGYGLSDGPFRNSAILESNNYEYWYKNLVYNYETGRVRKVQFIVFQKNKEGGVYRFICRVVFNESQKTITLEPHASLNNNKLEIQHLKASTKNFENITKLRVKLEKILEERRD